MDDSLALYLARQARALGLDPGTLNAASPETLRAFAQVGLHELSARGLLAAAEEVGCWSAPRSSGH